MKRQAGFTLIELIAVIVILGIIAAVAVPRFVDLSDAARDAAVQGVAGGLASASSLNNANNIAASAGLTITDPVEVVADCQDVGDLLQGGLPNNFEIESATVADGAEVECTVHTPSVADSEASATFTAFGVGTAVTP